MAENYRFFGSAEGDIRSYNQLEFAEVLKRVFTNGYFPGIGSGLEVIQNSPAAMSVKVGIGEGWINGYWYQNDAEKTLIVATANLTNPRIDTVVLRLDTVTNRSITIEILTGTPSVSPVAPTLTQNFQIYEIPLANIAVGASVSSVSTVNITDRRVACEMGIAPEMIASAISNTPAGGISSNTVQGALNELDTEKVATGDSRLSDARQATNTNTQLASLGVGTAASGTSGEIRATNNITAYYSDERLKDFFGTIPFAVEKIKLLNGYYFKENSKAKELGYNNDRLQVGVSAQEIEYVLPEAVTDAPIGLGYKTVWYEKLVPLLIEAIKEQQIQIDGLKAMVDVHGSSK